MWLRKLAFLGGRRRRFALIAVAVTGLLLAGCGSSPRSSPSPGPAFPSTPAGVQAQWLFQAIGKPPIPAAAIRAHFDAALVPHALTALNVALTGVGQPGLVSVTSTQPNSAVFVMSVRGGQRFRVGLTVDAHGLISGLTTPEVPPTASPASVIPALAPGWAAQPVTFEAGGVTIHGTYTHPGSAAAGTLPAALLIAAYGSSTDRNDNGPGQQDRNTLEAVANWLSADGVASLRYDKLGSGQTGWGRYAAHPDQAGLGTYEQESVAALNFLAGQRQVDRARLAVFGHSEGGLYALLLASGLAGPAPKVRAVALLEPVPMRFLDLIRQSATASITREVTLGNITAAQATSTEQAFATMIASLRRTGALPVGMQAGVGVAAIFQQPLREATQIDRYDPATVAARLPAHTPVLLTCSNADGAIGCDLEDHLAAGLARTSARLDYVHLDGVSHFLKDDITQSTADYNESLPFSAQLRAALKTFLARNL
jgi:alpha-beta hydrolase superfamily lysophospholipase